MKNRLTEWLTKPLIEDIEIPVEIGDTILTGRFKNKKTKVKGRTFPLLMNYRTNSNLKPLHLQVFIISFRLES